LILFCNLLYALPREYVRICWSTPSWPLDNYVPKVDEYKEPK